ncbi:MAG: 50S ribosomal protein L15 [Chloroflexi bacterium]|nr:50S ribosomal protein L15 [Chloroflexota bacterium]
MQVHELRPPLPRKHRKRVGRGDGSGHGSYSGRGVKGQKARSGPGLHPWFRGGQLPLVKALPAMRGFTNTFRIEYQEVNLGAFARVPQGTEVTPEVMRQYGLIKRPNAPVKVLGGGELEGPRTVQAHKFSKSAREKIEAAGGTVREL